MLTSSSPQPSERATGSLKKHPLLAPSAGTLTAFKSAVEGWARSAYWTHHLASPLPVYWTNCDCLFNLDTLSFILHDPHKFTVECSSFQRLLHGWGEETDEKKCGLHLKSSLLSVTLSLANSEQKKKVSIKQQILLQPEKLSCKVLVLSLILSCHDQYNFIV